MGSVLILGAGAIGGWLAARIALGTDEEVTLVGRGPRVAALRAEGLVLETLDEDAHSITLRSDRIAFVDDLRTVATRPDVVIVATRAYQTAEAMAAAQEAGLDPRIVVTLQNGLGNAEVLADAFGADRVLAGTTSHGVTSVPPTTVRHAGAGDTRLGPWDASGLAAARRVATLLERAGIPTETVADPRPALWQKVAVNAAINPLSALHRVLNGALLDGGEKERTLRAAAREAAAVARAEGVPLDLAATEEAAVTVARRTAANRSSMLQALVAGKPLEREAITGEVVRRAARHGIPVPVNAALLAALGALGPAPPTAPPNS